MQRSGQHLIVAASLLASLSACSGVYSVRGEVVHPAEIPVRSFPRIWVVLGLTPQERSLATALAHHLDGEADVELVELRDLEPLRSAGRIPQATVVLLPRIAFNRGTETRWTSRPQTICGSSGCYRTRRSYQYDVPTLVAEATLTVYDGPTAVVRQEAKVDVSDDARDYDVMENRAVASLSRKLGRMVDQRVEIVDVELLEVDDESVEEAIALIRDGDWPAGRRRLEAIAGDGSDLSALAPEVRARVLYDLGISRLYDRTSLSDPAAHFSAARAAIAAAFDLDPAPRYQRALSEVEAHRQRFEAVRRQDAAREHNYRLGEGIPQAPPAYRELASPPPSSPDPDPGDPIDAPRAPSR